MVDPVHLESASTNDALVGSASGMRSPPSIELEHIRSCLDAARRRARLGRLTALPWQPDWASAKVQGRPLAREAVRNPSP
jgi:hypothetical protein